ncbi:hypothetical protein N7528_002208 [Penicillium herquei]|nr:hypothetical protein N7528_002208 [Penicillium herquei]
MAKEARIHPPFQDDSDFECDRPSLEEPNIHTAQQQALLSPVRKPHREQKTITPHEYKQAIYAHSQRSLLSSSFPGHNYAALANWLIRPNPDFHSHRKDTGKVREDKHSLVVVHNLDDDGPERTQRLTEEDLPDFVGSTTSHQGKGQLLFVQGFPSPTLVANLGSRYRIDPEFFCRHLDFFDISAHGQYFNMPSLLNSTNNIIHVSVSTILTNATAYSTTNSHEDFISNRQLMRHQMFRYKRSLQNSASCGDSIVREYSILSDRYSIIEQRVSICLAENGDSWTGKLLHERGYSIVINTDRD